MTQRKIVLSAGVSALAVLMAFPAMAADTVTCGSKAAIRISSGEEGDAAI